MITASIQPVRGRGLLCLILVALSALAAPGAPAGLAQGGCAAGASSDLAAAPAAFSPSGAIGLSYAGSLGGDTNAAASYGGVREIYFSRGADLATLIPPFPPPFTNHYPDTIRDIAVNDTGVYIAAGAGGLQIDQFGGRPHGALYPPGLVSAVELDGPRAYLASAGARGGLQVIDVADPGRPRLLGGAPTYGSAAALDVSGGMAYVAEGVGGGVEIFDVTNPLAPALRGALITPGAARGVAVQGGRAYVAGGSCGLQVLDVADPARPRMLGALATGGEALAIQIAAGRAYVAAGEAGLLVFDLGGGLPRQVGARSFGPGSPIRDVYLDGIYAHLAAGPAGTISVDTTGAGLRLVGSAGTLSGVRAARAAGGAVYMAIGDGGIAQAADLDAQAPGPRLYPALGLAVGATVGGEPTLYSAGGAAGIGVHQRTAGGQIVARGSLSLPGTVGAILVDGGLAYAAAGDAGVHVLSLTSPLSPTLRASVSTPGAALDLALAGGLLYVADRDGMRVIDPAVGRVVGGYDAPAGSFVQGVAVEGGRAYLADRRGLTVLDVSDPTRPTPLPGVAGFSAYGLAARGGQLFVAAGKDGVLAFDLGGPAGPRLAAVYDTPGTALGLSLDGDELLVSDNEAGLLRLRVVAFPHRLRLPLVLT